MHNQGVVKKLSSKLKREFSAFVKGEVRFDEPMAEHTTFKIGGPADIWTIPKNKDDLKEIIQFSRKKSISLFVVGNGSNLLVSDRGVRGIVVKLNSSHFNKIRFLSASSGWVTLAAGAGASLKRLLRTCLNRGIGGCEFLAGIPGTLGGAVAMNAGAALRGRKRSIGSLVEEVTVIDRAGRVKKLKKEGLKFSERKSNLSNYIILKVKLRLKKKKKPDILLSIERCIRNKKLNQPLGLPNAGSIFKNPDGDRTSGELIDVLGLKGKRIGDAMVSVRHANFIVNKGNARAGDVLRLMRFVRKTVKKAYGIELEPEIKIIGVK